ncbi:MAG: bacteriohemerythrin [Bacteriovoracaceae bacterium]|nr:bacteriohemerythrin [Bacteriovoracaceae bacterium]
MGLMEWSDKLDIGVPTMNHEHQNLLNLMNQLFDKWEKKASRAEIQTAIEKLKVATTDHFKHEEVHLEKIKWEKLASHKIIHKRLLDDLDKFEKEYKAGAELGKPFFTFLKMWLTGHIQGIDSEYGTKTQSLNKSA